MRFRDFLNESNHKTKQLRRLSLTESDKIVFHSYKELKEYCDNPRNPLDRVVLEAKEVKNPYTGKTLEVYKNMTSVFPNPLNFETVYNHKDLKKPLGTLVFEKSNGYIGCVTFDKGYDGSNKTVFGFFVYQLKSNGNLDPKGKVWSLTPNEFKDKFPKETDAVKFIQEVNHKCNGKKLDELNSIIQKIFEKY